MVMKSECVLGHFAACTSYFLHHMYVNFISCGWTFGISEITAWGALVFNSHVQSGNVLFTWKGYKSLE